MAPSATTITEKYESVVVNRESLKSNNDGYHGRDNTSDLVVDTLKERIVGIDSKVCEAGEEDAFFVADMGEVYRQHLRWKMNLKRVKPHYGIFP